MHDDATVMVLFHCQPEWHWYWQVLRATANLKLSTTIMMIFYIPHQLEAVTTVRVVHWHLFDCRWHRDGPGTSGWGVTVMPWNL